MKVGGIPCFENYRFKLVFPKSVLTEDMVGTYIYNILLI